MFLSFLLFFRNYLDWTLIIIIIFYSPMNNYSPILRVSCVYPTQRGTKWLCIIPRLRQRGMYRLSPFPTAGHHYFTVMEHFNHDDPRPTQGSPGEASSPGPLFYIGKPKSFRRTPVAVFIFITSPFSFMNSLSFSAHF